MYIESYKQLKVWQRAMELVKEIYNITNNFPKSEVYGLASQMQRSAVSIPSNIAEGHKRKGQKEFLQFLSIAEGSSAELETQLIISKDIYPNNDYSKSFLLLEEVQKMLPAMIKGLNAKRSTLNANSGFTLIEMLIYVTIIGGILTTFVSFGLSVSNSRSKVYAVQEVQANTREAMEIMTQKIRSASGVNAGSSQFGVDPGYLSLSMTSSTLNPTIISLNHDDGVIEIKEGSSASTTIMADEVKVTNFVFTNLTDRNRENIRINMTAQFDNPNNDPNFAYTQSLQTSASVRY